MTAAEHLVGLDVEDLSVTYGGHRVLDRVTMSAPAARITGLIGPNGAGKTTMFNACCGLLRPQSGTVRLFGQDLTGKSPARRARAGLGRTFQRMELVNAMTAGANVALGAECRRVGSNPAIQILASRGQSRAIRSSTEAALQICGLASVAERTVGSLSTGQRRLVELARVLAGGSALLLLDEPSSGLDEAETEQFGEILRAAVRERGLGILLVEHDMDLVMAICGHLYVLEFGRLIFEGTPRETQASDLVRAAYLGTDAAVGASA